MLGTEDNKRAQSLLAKKIPSYRKAYSDRTAWLMAYMAELAYLKFEKPNAESEITIRLVKRALKRARRGTAEKIIGAICKSYAYDYEAGRDNLKNSLDQIGWRLVETVSVNGTQAFVACNDDFAVLAFRGTEADSMKDIKADAKATQIDCPTNHGRVHSGFNGQYDDVACHVEDVLDRRDVRDKPLFITGHSLGGAVATIATRRLTAERRIAACYTYGSPRVGNEGWVTRIKTPIYRIVNSADPVPMVPLSGTAIFWIAKALRAVGRTIPAGRFVMWVGNWVEKTMSGYAHAGSMRFLTNGVDRDLTKVEMLYTVGWGRRFRGVLNGVTPWAKVLEDHKITAYRNKMMHVAERRNP